MRWDGVYINPTLRHIFVFKQTRYMAVHCPRISCGTMQAWNFETLALLRHVKSSDLGFRLVAFSSNGLRIVDLIDSKSLGISGANLKDRQGRHQHERFHNYTGCPETSVFCFETKGEVEEFENSGDSTQSIANPPRPSRARTNPKGA